MDKASGNLTNEASNRRLYHRYSVGLEAEIECEESSFRCKVMDLSLGGAGVEPGFPEIIGTHVQLNLEDVSSASGIRAEVVRSDTYRCNLRFSLDDDTEAALVLHLMADPATRE